eukprot:TRINITY_DN184_c1_g1_i10.p1 TRINITY_DN184_c1_g1~~TRINITY_DN184_c1_g1_i10.p1  ORF type:complete len:304 (+),score=60.11 TRINITY_DN184_c1_g1_i10:56-913(+)
MTADEVPTTINPQQAFPPQLFNLPPVMSKYQEGINFNAKGPEKIDVAKQFFKEHVSSMHTGKVYELFEAWMDEDSIWASERLPLAMRGRGPVESTEIYNLVISVLIGGPKSTLTVRLLSASYNAKLDVVRLDIMTSVLRAGETTPEVEGKRLTIKFKDNMKIARAVVSPCGDSSIHPVSRMELPCGGEDKEEKPTTPTSPASLQLPTYDRPCLHNNWDPVRVKRGNSLLRCRVCGSQWKLPVQKVSRCRRYLSDGCNKGSLCTALHVNGRKLTHAQRTGDENQSA